MTRWLWTLGCFAVWLVGCGNQVPPPAPATFERPGAVAFVCIQTQDGNNPLPVPIECCYSTAAAGATTVGRPAATICGPDTSTTMHALLAQTSRGEVAAVDLRNKNVIDSRPDIPGFTFVPVGELPVAIAVARHHPAVTYVANAGSRDLTVVKTAAFRHLDVGGDPVLQAVRLVLPGMAALGAQSPSAMEMSPDEDALFVAFADAGALLRLPIQRCTSPAGGGARANCVEGTLDTPASQLIPLTQSLAKATPSSAAGTENEPYQKACDSQLLLPAPKQVATSIPADAATKTPRPIALAVDAFCRAGTPCVRRLLVADGTLPIIHSFDLDAIKAGNPGAAVLAPIVTGVPTSALAVTPPVPTKLVGGDCGRSHFAGETQYVYAIDATDGSVLVTQGNRVLSVSSEPSSRPDRIAFGPPGATGIRLTTGQPIATAIEVVRGIYDTNNPLQGFDQAAVAPYARLRQLYGITDPGPELISLDDTVPNKKNVCAPPDLTNTAATDARLYCTDSTNTAQSSSRLRGVFVAVGISDGTVRIVDVHDLALAECHTCPYPVVRHRPRLLAAIDLTQPAPILAPTTGNYAPVFTIGTGHFFVNADGTVDSPEIEQLACITCGANKFPAFPDQQTIANLVDGGIQTSTASTATADAAAAKTADAGKSTVFDAGLDAAASGDNSAAAPSITLGQLCHDLKRDSRVCAPADPWIAVGLWDAVFEGILPGTQGGHGRFVDAGSADSKTGQLEFAGEANFCKAGVLGSDDLKAEHHDGDQLVITSRLVTTDWPEGAKRVGTAGHTLAEECVSLDNARAAGDVEIAFPITRSFADRLVIGNNMIAKPSGVSSASYTFVRQCFRDMLMTYAVRTRNSYTVIDRRTGSFSHRVVTDSSGRCVEDRTQSPLRNARAYDRTRFENAVIAFQIDQRVRPDLGTTLTIGLPPSVPQVVLDANSYGYSSYHGVLPSFLRFNDIDQQLYMVDPAIRGLVPIPLDPFTSVTGMTYQ
jgi:hypothetical protein